MIIKAKFNSICSACNCKINVGEGVEWFRGANARHATPQQCRAAQERREAERAAKEASSPKIDLTSVSDFLKAAQERGLKNPKLRVLAMGAKREMRLSITKRGANPGSIAVVDGDVFLGCIRPNGSTTGQLTTNAPLQDYLLRIAKDPVNAAKEYAALMGLCSFCGLQLTDAGSVEVGYGPVCAKHWGLPHKPKGVPKVEEVPE